MRQLLFDRAPNESTDEFLDRSLQAISEATFQDLDEVLQSYAVTGFSAKRDLDAGTATVADVANFLATLINDIKSAGQN